MKFILPLVTVFLLPIIGCSLVGEDNPRTSLSITVRHHDRPIPGTEVYVKFFATEFPGYELEDVADTTLVADADGQVKLNDFPLGNHWFVGIGYDEAIRELVIGNLDLRFDLTNLQHDTILYVSEEH